MWKFFQEIMNYIKYYIALFNGILDWLINIVSDFFNFLIEFVYSSYLIGRARLLHKYVNFCGENTFSEALYNKLKELYYEFVVDERDIFGYYFYDFVIIVSCCFLLFGLFYFQDSIRLLQTLITNYIISNYNKTLLEYVLVFVLGYLTGIVIAFIILLLLK